MIPRIQPLTPPYLPEEATQLSKMMPPGVEPIGLFRTFARNLPMSKAMGPWGAYELSRQLSISLRDREIVINRVCARCKCEYEWGVHVAFFAAKAQFNGAQIRSLTHGSSTDPCWETERDRVLISIVDELHDSSDVTDTLWAQSAAIFAADQLLDVLMLTGWYHAISFTARAARVELEVGAPRFSDYNSEP